MSREPPSHPPSANSSEPKAQASHLIARSSQLPLRELRKVVYVILQAPQHRRPLLGRKKLVQGDEIVLAHIPPFGEHAVVFRRAPRLPADQVTRQARCEIGARAGFEQLPELAL